MRRSSIYRWVLVAVAAAAMGASGTYQFVWSSLSGAVGSRVGAAEPALGTVFTLYAVTQTLVQLPAGAVRDRYGPRLLLFAAGVLMTAGYAGVALAPTIVVVYASYVLGGIGAGIAYTVAVNTPVKWFEKRQGLATGVVAMAYSGASVIAIPVIRGSIDTAFTTTLLGFAAVVGLVGLVAALVVRDPRERPDGSDARAVAAGAAGADAVDTESAGMLGDPEPTDTAPPPASSALVGSENPIGVRTVAKTWQFWTLYGAVTAATGVGLMLIGQSVGLTVGLGLSADVATAVATVVALGDGLGILVVGSLSDRFGGERTAGVSLLLCGLSLAGAIVAASRGLVAPFVLLTAATAFFRSPVFSIFPTLVGSYYGTARSSENYAAVYSGKVPGGVLGGTVSGVLIASYGWSASFLLGAAVLALAGIATLALHPPAVGPTEPDST